MSVGKYRYTTSLYNDYTLFSVTADNIEQARREIRMYLAHRYALFRVKDADVDKLIINKQPEKLTKIDTLKL